MILPKTPLKPKFRIHCLGMWAMRSAFLRNLASRFRKLRGKYGRPFGGKRGEGAGLLQAILANEIEALEVADAAKNDTGPSLILKPVIRSGPPEAGWFGGEPMLPPHVEWPEIDGVPLCFLAQIDLAKLPTQIWSGLGPREGFLVFFNHPNRCDAKVLYVKGDLATRSADVPLPDFRDHGAAAPRYPYYNKFPVTAIEHVGQMPEPIGWIPGRSSKFPAPFGGDKEELEVANPQQLPFDATSLDIMIKCMSDEIDLRLRQCAIQLDKEPMKTARRKLLSVQTEATETRKAFDEALRNVKGQSFDPEKCAAFIRETGSLPLTHFELIRGSDYKVTDINPVFMSLIDPEKSNWSGKYLLKLNNYLFECFVREPDNMSALHRDRIEQICEFRAAHESGGMSHAPHGFIYTPHGQGSANEVLLELPSSYLTGWVWGDFYSLVFLIDRKALERGEFEKIMVDITN
ncbi:DUF1963 domain-containing protein [Thioclava sp. SK-1]|uniref:DUF1963 domain-containing protein n=1 Tax=Thioclava sp. SK-1 TaxID=1889770 RepID=UPI0009F4491A|nr:DUF1963 domain-containing protein [Thioclava sp. SK-1]